MADANGSAGAELHNAHADRSIGLQARPHNVRVTLLR